MGRPVKKGLDYFPLDVRMDDNIKLIEAEYGLLGFAVIIKLYQKIYENGYYCDWTYEVALLFAREIGAGGNFVSEIIQAAIRRGIFDKKMFNKYHILTSKGIQKRYLTVCKRRKDFEVDNRYLLISIPIAEDNADKNGINVNENSINVGNNTQSKEKKSKVYISSCNNINIPTLKEVKLYFEQQQLKGNPETFYNFNKGNNWKHRSKWQECAKRWSMLEKENQNSFAAYDLSAFEKMLDEDR